MSVPAEVTIKNLHGTFSLNKELSGDTDAVLYLQSVGWIARQAIKWSSVTVKITQGTDDKGNTTLELVQTSSGMNNTEPRTLDWEDREKEDMVFGKVSGRMKYAKVSEVQNEYLKQDIEAGPDDTIIYAENTSVGLGNEWTALQLWSFQEIEGKRRHVRRVNVTRDDQSINLLTVYDWVDTTAAADEEEEEEEEELPGA